MSDIDEQHTQLPTNGSSHSLTTITTTASTAEAPATIRYSKHVLLSLHDSPLVAKPDSMPSLSSWFSEETGSPAVSKNILNGSVSSRSSDKSIVLGPPKTNFASSLYGGLKHTTDTNSNSPLSTSKLSSSTRLRQSEDSIRTHSTGSNGNSNGNRMPRGPNYVGEKGFHHYNYHNNSNNSGNGNINNNSNSSNTHHHHHHHHHNRQEKSGLERRTSNPYGNSSSSHNKRYSHSDHQGERQSINADAGRREFNRDQRPGHHRSNHSNHNEARSQERVPEWMDYNPDTKKTADLDDKSDRRGEFANDLEAWKSSMKKKDGLAVDTVEKQPPSTTAAIEDPLPQEQATSDAMEKILGLDSLELKTASSPIAPFLDSSSLPSPTSDLPSKRGSRFAKFFAKRGEAAQVPPSSSPLAHETSTQDSQPRSISVNDLFQTPGGGGIGSLSQQQQQQPLAANREMNGNPTDSSRDQDLPPNARMLSEEDVLQSLGAKKSVSSSEPPVHESDKNAMGFNKVLQILSQSKPTVPESPPTDTSIPSPSSNANTFIKGQDKKRDSSEEALSGTIHPPTVKQPPPSDTETASTPHGTTTTPPSAAKPKKVSNLFGGNLPTSVLRQMSARSEGRSPSLASTKSGHSGRFSHSATNSQNGSPLIGHASPSSPSAHMALPAQHQHHQQQPQTQSPSNYGYQQGFPLRTTAVQPNTHGNVYPYPHQHHDLGNEDRPMVNDMMLMNAHVPRNQANGGYDMMVQQLYSESGMAPRPLPPTLHQPGSTMNGQMNRIMSPKFTQQQQTMGQSYMNTHPHPPPPPPMMGMPGAHPMMSPHMSMRLQGQAGNAGNVVPPPFMQQPLMPGMPPPMGMPQQQQQQMYTNKNHGWNHQ